MYRATTMPPRHAELLENLVEALAADDRIVGVAAAGSFASDTMDEFSDIDLVVAVEPEHWESVHDERAALVAGLDGNIARFTGEHVGEPRLVIALFEPGLVHVDFKFVALPDAAASVDHLEVVWARDARLGELLATAEPHFPEPDIQWIEDRFWVWLHYVSVKIARGEHFEALDFLGFLRGRVLGPLALARGGHVPAGVRRIERLEPEFSQELLATISTHDADALIDATRACVRLYRTLRHGREVVRREEAERASESYFEGVASRPR